MCFKIREVSTTFKLEEEIVNDFITQNEDEYVQEMEMDHTSPMRFDQQNIIRELERIDIEDGNEKYHDIRQQAFKDEVNSISTVKQTCRICLSDGSEDDLRNPLLSPCRCSGTMGYIHEECFK